MVNRRVEEIEVCGNSARSTRLLFVLYGVGPVHCYGYCSHFIFQLKRLIRQQGARLAEKRGDERAFCNKKFMSFTRLLPVLRVRAVSCIAIILVHSVVFR